MTPLALLPYYADPCFEHSEALNRSGLPRLVVRSSCIDQARNVLLAAALDFAPRHDVFLFIDGDISFQPLDYEFLEKAAHETRGIVGAPYATKEWPAVFVGAPSEARELIAFEGGGVYPANTLGMGFTAIHREAAERMVAAHPPVRMSVVDRMAAPLFLPMVRDGRCWPEDQSFCLRASDLGIAIHLDTRPRLTHYGRHGFRLEQLGAELHELPTLSVSLKEHP